MRSGRLPYPVRSTTYSKSSRAQLLRARTTDCTEIQQASGKLLVRASGIDRKTEGVGRANRGDGVGADANVLYFSSCSCCENYSRAIRGRGDNIHSTSHPRSYQRQRAWYPFMILPSHLFCFVLCCFVLFCFVFSKRLLVLQILNFDGD